MKGYRFYAELPAHQSAKLTRKELSDTAQRGEFFNVVAICFANGTNGAGNYDALAAVNDTPNAFVESASPSADYLGGRCIAISEDLARQLHPTLFAALDGQAASANAALER